MKVCVCVCVCVCVISIQNVIIGRLVTHVINNHSEFHAIPLHGYGDSSIPR